MLSTDFTIIRERAPAVNAFRRGSIDEREWLIASDVAGVFHFGLGLAMDADEVIGESACGPSRSCFFGM